ncbi:acetoacetyl-CoA reductase [Nevskia sp.]|uniref:acetoacetyl-CoA reductase n=1 Tax=Nevskia sp. TaxID=1929292 RepID=UPI0025EB4E77|nr:acetoacetyl-CoA reductase [Nevskia sp.]
MKLDLSTRTALVTGGTGAIGRAVSAALAAAGAKVIAVCLPSDQASAETLLPAWREQGLAITITAFDVSNAEDTAAALSALTAQGAAIDIVVNCAGITRDAPLRKMSAHQWQQVLRVNLDSLFNVTQPLIEAMCQRGWGRVVNISSVNGQKGQFGQTNYSASKAGVHGFTMALAQEVARKGVTVNTVAPGYIDSPMIDAVPEAIRSEILKGIPAARYGSPADIAAAVTFLCSGAASYITGAQLPVNGGLYMSA